MVKEQLPLQPVKSTTGTVTRQGSLMGTAPEALPPMPSAPPTEAPFAHGSKALPAKFVLAAEHDANRLARPAVAGLELPLVPVEEFITWPTEKLSVEPLCSKLPRRLALLPWPTSTHCQLPDAPTLPTNF